MTKTDTPDQRLFTRPFSSKNAKKKKNFSIYITSWVLMERIMHLDPVESWPSQSSAAISGFHPIFVFSRLSPAPQRLLLETGCTDTHKYKPKKTKQKQSQCSNKKDCTAKNSAIWYIKLIADGCSPLPPPSQGRVNQSGGNKYTLITFYVLHTFTSVMHCSVRCGARWGEKWECRSTAERKKGCIVRRSLVATHQGNDVGI